MKNEDRKELNLKRRKWRKYRLTNNYERLQYPFCIFVQYLCTIPTNSTMGHGYHPEQYAAIDKES